MVTCNFAMALNQQNWSNLCTFSIDLMVIRKVTYLLTLYVQIYDLKWISQSVMIVYVLFAR